MGIRRSLVLAKDNVFNNSGNERHQHLEPLKDRLLFDGYVSRVELFQFYKEVVLRALPVLMILTPRNAVHDIVEMREYVGWHIDVRRRRQSDSRVFHVDLFFLKLARLGCQRNPRID